MEQPKIDELARAREARQAKNKITRLHHHAIRTMDMEATRAFYEGILQLPLVATWKEKFDPIRNKPTPYLHCFFELGDGSALAFFLFNPADREAPPPLPAEAYDHHISLNVEGSDDLLALRDRLKAAGYKHAVMDHGYCYSIYTRDPNGMLVELTTDPENGIEIVEEAAAKADTELAKWLAGDLSVNNEVREYHAWGIPNSPLEELLEIAVRK